MVRTQMLMRSIPAAVALLFTTAAQGLAQSCITVNKCETISVAGSYCVPTKMTITSMSGDCLVISAPNVSLALGNNTTYGASISGSGSGTAIHVLSAAQHFSFGSGWDGAITGFNIGIEDDANFASVFIGSNDYPTLSIDHVNTGIYMNHVRSSQLVYYILAGSISANNVGVWIYGGQQNLVTAGAYVDTSPKGVITGTNAGVLIQGSASNIVSGVGIGSPSGSGIFIESGSSGNLIYLNSVSGGPYGVRIKYDSPSNSVVNNDISATQYDMFQGTTNSAIGCNGDFWANNNSGGSGRSANQGCIGQYN